MTVNLWFYSRAGCQLCDEMLKEVETLQSATKGAFTVEVLDIDRDPETQRRYSLRIPVLTAEAGAKILCETRFHRQAVLDYLAVAAR